MLSRLRRWRERRRYEWVAELGWQTSDRIRRKPIVNATDMAIKRDAQDMARLAKGILKAQALYD